MILKRKKLKRPRDSQKYFVPQLNIDNVSSGDWLPRRTFVGISIAYESNTKLYTLSDDRPEAAEGLPK